MKKAALLLFLIVLVCSAKAQRYDRRFITFEHFKEKVENIRIPGFHCPPVFDDVGEMYQVAYIQGNDLLVIQLEKRHYPPVWSDAPYRMNGNNAEFIEVGDMRVLTIDLPCISAVLSIASNKIDNKFTLERIARKTGIMKISASASD